MKAHLYLLEGAGMTARLEDFKPPDPEDVDMYLVAHVGPEGEVGKDLFHVRLLTAKSLGQLLYSQHVVWGRELIVVEKFDFKRIFDAVASLCGRVEGASWNEVAERLCHYLTWEMDSNALIDHGDQR